MSHFISHSKTTFAVIFSILFLSLTTMAKSQDSTYIRQHYTKYEYQIPMRDGVKLFTTVYVPKDKSKTYPILLKRTPYSVRPYGLDHYINHTDRQRKRYFREGYIIAYQDVRGRNMSEGTYMNVRPYIEQKRSNKDIDETTDTYDTVDWLIKHIPANNKRVGVSGISYPGFYSSMAAIDAHPAIKAVSPQAPVSKWMAGDDFFHNGAFLLPHAFDFFMRFGHARPKPTKNFHFRFNHGTPDEYQFFLNMGPLPNADKKYMKGEVAFWKTLMQHGQWDDFWAARNILPHLKKIKPAMLVVGGWFDTENLYGALHTYAAIEKNNPGTENRLVMGPWSHGEWAGSNGRYLGAIDFGSRTAEYYTEFIELPFFNYYLKGQGEMKLAEANVFETGANRWQFLDNWPPKNRQQTGLYLRSQGGLSFQASSQTRDQYDEYVSDPDNPVPYTNQITHWYNPAFMLEDQRFTDRRPDVLVYQTDILSDSVTVAGPITATLYVSTSGTDSDWIIKLIDVFPDTLTTPRPNPGHTPLGGYEMLVRGDVLRGKFRNDLSKPEPFVPNQVTKIQFQLQDIFHSFRKGHRIMVQIQSTWFPMIDRNPQKFVNIYQAKAEDFQKATQRIYHSAKYDSHLTFGVLK